MKLKLMAMLLAAGLGVTCIGATAHAAGGEKTVDTMHTVQDAGDHVHSWYGGTTIISYEEVGPLGHYKHTTIIYSCRVDGCDAIDSDWEKVLEDHTLVLTPDDHKWECTDCSYSEEIH